MDHALILLIISVIGNTVTNGDAPPNNCDYNIRLKGQEQYTFRIHNFTKPRNKGAHADDHGIANIKSKSSRYCTVLITTDIDRKIVFDLIYTARRMRKEKKIASTSSTSTSNDLCKSDYVHVGNDVTRLDVDVMTSYKFCGAENVRHELVSRGNKMWLVYSTKGARPKELTINVSSRKVVTCHPDEFTCSPVQCVNRDQVCDGVQDCLNGHDEYCVKTVQDLSPIPLSHNPSCFRCGDGTCISPRLPRYDLNWGRGLWYLCDGYPHCPDQWDERPDICLTLRRGKVNAIIQCVPSDLQLGINQSVTMWAERRCDDVEDCLHGEDEIRCKRENNESPLHADSLTLGFVIGFFVILLCGSAFVIYCLRTRTVVSSTEPTSDDIFLETTTVQSQPPYTNSDRSRCCSSNSTVQRSARQYRRARKSKRNAAPVGCADGKKFTDSSSDDVFTHNPPDHDVTVNEKCKYCDQNENAGDVDDNNGSDVMKYDGYNYDEEDDGVIIKITTRGDNRD